MLVLSPALLLWPGLLLFLCGTALQVLLLSGPRILFRRWDVHTNLAGLAAALGGSTLIVLGLVAAAFAWWIGVPFRHSWLARAVAQAGGGPGRVPAPPLPRARAPPWAAAVGARGGRGVGGPAPVPGAPPP